jgi:pimeloyl-ACP methyl ester carboxylesterase
VNIRTFEGAASCGEPLRLRVYSPPHHPIIVYLPGIHGDWTLIGGCRSRLLGKVCFAEFTYPRTTEWSLADYAREVESALARAGIDGGWILAESFGSQVAWPLCAHATRFRVEGLILAGGFGRYPLALAARAVALLVGHTPASWFKSILGGYARIARWRFRRAPPSFRGNLEEFIARRTPRDRDAAVHRLDLIREAHPEALARAIRQPVYYLSGLIDPVVPWFLVPRWLRRNCPGFVDWRIVRAADHNVLGTGSRRASDQILRWITQ